MRLLGQVRGKGFVYAGGSYEDNRVYDAAGAGGYQLRADPVGRGGRRRARVPERVPAARAELLRHRATIERRFAHAGGFGGGLGPLPNWVRRLGRVARWVCCELIINAARIIRRQQHL